jgi:Xaa-Pro aminopeptidase
MRRKHKPIFLLGVTEFGAPHFSADLWWRTKFRVHDPVYFAEVRGRRFLFVSGLELGRAREEADVHAVIELQALMRRTRAKTALAAVGRFLALRKVSRLAISSYLGYAAAVALRKNFKLLPHAGSLYPERAVKTAWEIGEITCAQHAVERALAKTRSVLKASRVRGKRIFYCGKVLTSEFLRGMIEAELFHAGYFASGTIVASGRDAANPHAEGRGPILPYVPIVFDIFPISRTTHYAADCTRTLFKGKPSAGFARMYDAVLGAHQKAVKEIRAGVFPSLLHRTAEKYLAAQGYPTLISTREASGFIHSLGHGVGIAIHEAPAISARNKLPLAAGNVITIEPGLYYQRPRFGIPAGGIRLEDMFVVTRKSFRGMSDLPKVFSWAVIS